LYDENDQELAKMTVTLKVIVLIKTTTMTSIYAVLIVYITDI